MRLKWEQEEKKSGSITKRHKIRFETAILLRVLIRIAVTIQDANLSTTMS